MLYERWRHIANEYRDEIALIDLEGGERWTFSELALRSEKFSTDSSVVFPQGKDFLLTLLGAWREGKVACPLEKNQNPPQLSRLPPGVVHLKTTSATTGAARVVAFTAEQLAADAGNIVATMRLRRDWPNLGVISLAHSYGFSNLVLPLLLHGIPLILIDTPLPEMLARAAGQAQFVTLAAVPTLWSVWHGARSIPKNVRLAISAGAPLSLAIEQSVLASHHLKIHNFYGSSECGGIAYDDSSEPRSDANCVGRAMQNVELSIAEDGCLEVRGKAVGETYWPQSAPNLSDGRFRTSDLVEMNNGLVFLRGRASDQMNIAGRKLSPDEIEKALLAHPQVRECLVFGVPSRDSDRTDTIVACVAAPPSITGELLKQFLLEKLPAWQIPREWFFVESLQTNLRGKLSRADWRRQFMARQG